METITPDLNPSICVKPVTPGHGIWLQGSSFAVEALNQAGEPPLILAAKTGLLPLARNILAQAADVNRDIGDGRTALHFAVLRNDQDMVALLLEAGANPNLHERFGEPLPMIASSHPDGEHVLRLLILAGSNADVPNFYMTTPLHQAAKNGSIGCVESLISARVRLDPQESWGHTPLMLAVSQRHDVIVRRLIQAGAATNVPDKFSRTALHYAARRGMSDIVQLLLEEGANPNIPDANGNIPLVEAAFHGLTSIVVLLIQGNCNVNARGQCLQLSWKPLMAMQIALARRNYDVVRVLCAAGCDVTMEIIEGYGRVYSHGDNTDIDTLLVSLLRTPRSLYDCCRLAVRKNLHLKVTSKILQLPIPVQIKQFLTFTELNSEIL